MGLVGEHEASCDPTACDPLVKGYGSHELGPGALIWAREATLGAIWRAGEALPMGCGGVGAGLGQGQTYAGYARLSSCDLLVANHELADGAPWAGSLGSLGVVGAWQVQGRAGNRVGGPCGREPGQLGPATGGPQGDSDLEVFRRAFHFRVPSLPGSLVPAARVGTSGFPRRATSGFPAEDLRAPATRRLRGRMSGALGACGEGSGPIRTVPATFWGSLG